MIAIHIAPLLWFISLLMPCPEIDTHTHTHTHLVTMSTIFLVVCLTQILWTFSIYLESVAILPQLFMISKTGEAETITTHYLFFLGLYRALYLINWVWRFYFEGFFDMIAIVAGVVQTILYCDFFYLYITKGKLLNSLSRFCVRCWNPVFTVSPSLTKTITVVHRCLVVFFMS